MPITIKIRENGSLFITADDAQEVRLVDHLDQPVLPTPGKGIALCRCGVSQRKPFCDSSHKTCGFDGTLAPPVPPAP